MRAPAAILCGLTILLGFGCTPKAEPTSLPQAPNPTYTQENGKKIAWCDQTQEDAPSSETFQNRELWIHKEMFSGMTHEPTIHHICWAAVERFAVHMGDKNADGSRTGYFVLPGKPQAFVFGNTTSEPTVTLRNTGRHEERDPIDVIVDGQQFTYDPTTQHFFKTK